VISTEPGAIDAVPARLPPAKVTDETATCAAGTGTEMTTDMTLAVKPGKLGVPGVMARDTAPPAVAGSGASELTKGTVTVALRPASEHAAPSSRLTMSAPAPTAPTVTTVPETMRAAAASAPVRRADNRRRRAPSGARRSSLAR
jgi:hypothetical protein